MLRPLQPCDAVFAPAKGVSEGAQSLAVIGRGYPVVSNVTQYRAELVVSGLAARKATTPVFHVFPFLPMPPSRGHLRN